MARKKRPCEGCRYASGASCDYYLITGRRRPCPPGQDCTVKEPARRHKAPRKPAWFRYQGGDE